MSHHACYSLTTDFLDIVLIEDSKPMQMILRSVLTSLHAQRVRVFDNPTEALKSILREPPNLILSDWRMPGMSGYRFLRAIRSGQTPSLCFVPVIVITAHATESVIQNAMRAGAHMVMVKPVAPSALFERIDWLLRDSRKFVMGDEATFVLEGTREKLAAHRMRGETLARVRSTTNRPARVEPVPQPVKVDRVDEVAKANESTEPARRPAPVPPRVPSRRRTAGFAATVSRGR